MRSYNLFRSVFSLTTEDFASLLSGNSVFRFKSSRQPFALQTPFCKSPATPLAQILHSNFEIVASSRCVSTWSQVNVLEEYLSQYFHKKLRTSLKGLNDILERNE